MSELRRPSGCSAPRAIRRRSHTPAEGNVLLVLKSVLGSLFRTKRRINWEARLLKMKLTPFVIWLTASAKFPLMSHAARCFLIRQISQITVDSGKNDEWQSRRRIVSLSENGLAKTLQFYKLWNFPAEEAAYWTGNGATITFLLMCERNWWSAGMLRGRFKSKSRGAFIRVNRLRWKSEILM